MRTLSNFFQDLRNKYSTIEPTDWTIFVLNQDGYGFKEEPENYHKTRVTDCHIAFGGSSWSQDFAELETLASNGQGVIAVPAMHFYQDFAAEVAAAKTAQDPQERALEVAERALRFRITDQVAFAAAGEFLKELKEFLKQVDERCDPVIAAAYTAHKEACAQKKKFAAPIEAAMIALKKAMAEYTRAEERRIEEERRIAEAKIALERAEFEKHRHEVSEALFAEGKHKEAMAVKSAIMPLPEVLPQEVAPVADGVYIRKTYSAEVVDLFALVTAIVQGDKSLLAYIMPNQKALDAFARAAKTDTCYIPGVRFVAKDTVGVRA